MSKKQPSPPTVAISLEKTPVGWQVVEYTIQDGKVTDVKRTEPELRAVALEYLQRHMLRFWEI